MYRLIAPGLVAVALSFGCGTTGTPTAPKTDDRDELARTKADLEQDHQDKKYAPQKDRPPIDGSMIEFPISKVVEAYQGNEIAADEKYLHKRIKVTINPEIVERDKSGRAYIGTYRVQKRDSVEFYPPVVVFYVAPAEVPKLAKMRPGQTVTVHGVCKGKRKDNVYRGFDFYNFSVVVEDCTIDP